MKAPGLLPPASAESLIVPRLSRGARRAQVLLWRTGRQPHHDAYTLRSFQYLILLAGLWLVNLLDALTTLHGVESVSGWDAEANALLRVLAAKGGSIAFLVYKLGVITLVAFAFWRFHRALSRASDRARSERAARHLSGWRLGVEIATAALVLLFMGAAVNNLRFAGVL